MPDEPKTPAETAASPPPLVTQEQAPRSAGGAAHRPSHQDPQQIGAYRILEKVGEGGMGIIYKAEQRQPVRRIVALKVIKLGMDTREVIARFEAERQALAMMSHPNVARVLDAGTTDAGRPYFAMEFVAGVPLDEFCDHKKLTTRQRLMLFIPVCLAIQHAHQKGIIHRDLKPSNVLVTMIDAKACPKVIDFGIAKATNSQLTQQTLFTQTGAMIGTPAYMSPEQARTSGLDVDTRIDVYSLGVMLYELLTGTLPLDPDDLHKAGLDGMARIIQESEPQRPSTRITMLRNVPALDSKSTEIAQRHHTDPKTLHRELRGDLDCIVLKAMEKDPARRYQTANALSADLQRYLDDEPIAARPPSTTYRLRKLVRRHRVVFAGSAILLVLIFAGLAGTVFELLRAQHERDIAMESQRKAELSRSEAVAANTTMRDLFMSNLGTVESTERLAGSVHRLDNGWLASQPDTAASCRLMIAHAYLGAGFQADAERQFTEALQIAERSRFDGVHMVKGLALQGLGQISNQKKKDYSLAARQLEESAVEFRLAPGAELQAATSLEALSASRVALSQGALARQARLGAYTLRIETFESGTSGRSGLGPLLIDRGFLYLQMNQPRNTRADFEAAMTRGTGNNPFLFYYLALCQLYLNDVAAYRKTAADMLKQFAMTEDRQVAGRIVVACSVGSPPVAEYGRISRIADVAVGYGTENTRAAARWFYVGRALAQYRAGRYSDAQQSLVRARGVIGVYAPEAVEVISAMTQFRQSGDTPAARDTLRRTVQRFGGDLSRVEGQPTTLNLSDLMLLRVLKHESEAILASSPATRPATRVSLNPS